MRVITPSTNGRVEVYEIGMETPSSGTESSFYGKLTYADY